MSTDRSRSSWKADLVLEGGGVKGIALAGAVLGLAQAGYTFADRRDLGRCGRRSGARRPAAQR